ncbi:hypothetical protein PN497_12425 [Sphaerospermopsis kisseleviana CS-549]|uniref:Uncharacterized protein n=1 Tax=Sphaerospermopsis kisseleviana CS-549 TaxID=3021783 RepID=A0ABT4ZRW8_9CYAN|nr:hypothetical protein [Sphaerospermopsis kisseleviana]MDB9442160.1 hypothetical protein [Sphaerospermopsis kisseleviana CS-549]BAZ82401.1 hypothetical protein NIES73_36790 [Sphaerospermopsis kisseleviana NIES-73]
MSQSEPKLEHFAVKSQIVSELAFLFTIYILVTALLFLHFRTWDSTITRQVWGVFVYPSVLFGGVALAWRYVSHVIWILPIGSLVFMGLPFAVALLGGWSLIPLGIFGISATIFVYILYLSPQDRPVMKTLQLSGAGMILAVFYFFVVNGTLNYVFADINTYTNGINQDTLFHSAIVQMLAKFNTPSTGLDGVQPLSYHVGVHRWVAANLTILGGSAPVLLGICQLVAFLPAVFFATVLVFMCLLSTPLSTLVACGFTFLGLWLLAIRILDFSLSSESYNFSLPVFIAMIPVGQRWLYKARESNRWLTPLPLTLSVVAVLACGAAKISSGVILALFLILCGFIPKMWPLNQQKWRYLGLLLALGIAFFVGCLALAFNFSAGNLTNIFYPFHFARAYRSQFIWQNIVFLGLIIPFYWLQRNQEKFLVRSQVIILTLLFLASQLPGALLEIGGPSAHYFVQPVLLVTLLFTLAAVADYWSVNRKTGFLFIVDPVDHEPKPLSPVISWGVIGLVLIFSLSMGTGGSSHKDKVLGFAHRLVMTLDSFSSQSDSLTDLRGLSKIQHQSRLLLFPPSVNWEILNTKTELGYIQGELAKLTESKKLEPGDNLAIHISDDFSDFWQPQGRRNCWDKSFVIPAMTGLPLVNGVRGENSDCDLTKDFGMAEYSKESWNRPLSQEDICTKSTKLGFDKVLNVSQSQIQLYSCNGFDQK